MTILSGFAICTVAVAIAISINELVQIKNLEDFDQ